MKKAVKILMSGIVLSMVVVFWVYAQPVEPSPDAIRHEREKAVEKVEEGVIDSLGLTTEQRDELKENRIAHREKAKAIFESLKKETAKLKEELKNPEASSASVAPMATKIKSLQGQLVDLRIEGILTVKEILTPEQFAKFQQMVEERVEKLKEMRRYRRR